MDRKLGPFWVHFGTTLGASKCGAGTQGLLRALYRKGEKLYRGSHSHPRAKPPALPPTQQNTSKISWGTPPTNHVFTPKPGLVGGVPLGFRPRGLIVIRTQTCCAKQYNNKHTVPSKRTNILYQVQEQTYKWPGHEARKSQDKVQLFTSTTVKLFTNT